VHVLRSLPQPLRAALTSVPCAGPGLVVRELLGRVKATVMGAVANADVPLEDAAEAAGLPPTAPLDAVHCVVHPSGFLQVVLVALGRGAGAPPPPPPGGAGRRPHVVC